MTLFDYTDAATTARRLIDRFGGPVTVRIEAQAPAGSGAVWRGENVAARVDVATLGVLLDSVAGRGAEVSLGPLATRVLAAVPSGGESLDHATRVIVGTVDYRVVAVRALAPAGVVVLYEFDVER